MRSYLATNCVQCHQPGGASSGYWDARATTTTDLANLIGGPLVNDGGDPANRWAIPGDTAHSMIIKRLQGDGVPRMPPLGTSERDPAAEALLTNWINNTLPARQSYPQWQAEHFPTPDALNSLPGDDADGDGASNRLEFLLGQNPRSPDAPSQPASNLADGQMTLTFPYPANRRALIETTLDFTTWIPWNIPGNAPFPPATPQTRTLTAPLDGTPGFYRLRLSEL